MTQIEQCISNKLNFQINIGVVNFFCEWQNPTRRNTHNERQKFPACNFKEYFMQPFYNLNKMWIKTDVQKISK